MFFLKKYKKITTIIIFIVVISCNGFHSSIYQNNNKSEDKNEYIKIFEKNKIDGEKIFFPKNILVSERVSFYKNYLSNDYYYYYGTIYSQNGKYYFKSNKDKLKGCNQVMYSLENEDIYNFDEIAFDEIKKMFYAYEDNSLLFENFKSGKKTIIFVYNETAKNVFFKDTKNIFKFINENETFSYAVLSTDFLK